MRVLYFSLAYTPHDFRFLDALSRSRHEIFFLRLLSGPPYPELRPLPAGVREVSLGVPPPDIREPADWISVLPAVQARLAEIKPDLVQGGPVQSVGLLTAQAGFHPFFLMSWGGDMLRDADLNEHWRTATSLALAGADWFQCDCTAVKECALKFRPFAEDRVVQFPWGIDLNQFVPGGDSLGLRNRPGWENAFIVLSTRSWEPVYDIPTLLESFRLARQDEPSLRLILLGAGSGTVWIHDFIRRHALEQDVLLPGRISNDQSPPWFQVADTYASCSLTDGSSISLLEALAAGLPAVVSDIPGNREWVQPGANGWLVPTGQPAALAGALHSAIRLSTAERRAMQNNNRRLAENRANWSRNFSRLLDAYDQIESSILTRP